MTIYIRKKDNELLIKFDYSSDRVAKVKSIEGYKWDSKGNGLKDRCSVQKVFENACTKAGIRKDVSIHVLHYPNLNKIQTIYSETGFYRNSYCKRFGFYLYFILGFKPQNSTSEPLAFFHFGVTFLSFSSSKVARAFASSSVVMSRYTIVV